VVMDLMQERVDKLGGCITINSPGNIGVYMTSEVMSWAATRDKTIQYGLYKNEVHKAAYCE